MMTLQMVILKNFTLSKLNTYHDVNICAFHVWLPEEIEREYQTIEQNRYLPDDLSSPETVI